MLTDALAAAATLIAYAFAAGFVGLVALALCCDARRASRTASRRRAQRRAIKRERTSPAAHRGRPGLGLGFELTGGDRRRRDVTRSTRES